MVYLLTISFMSAMFMSIKVSHNNYVYNYGNFSLLTPVNIKQITVWKFTTKIASILHVVQRTAVLPPTTDNGVDTQSKEVVQSQLNEVQSQQHTSAGLAGTVHHCLIENETTETTNTWQRLIQLLRGVAIIIIISWFVSKCLEYHMYTDIQQHQGTYTSLHERLQTH